VGVRFLGLSGQEKRMIGSFMEDIEDAKIVTPGRVAA
jgi:hypothetical protein